MKKIFILMIPLLFIATGCEETKNYDISEDVKTACEQSLTTIDNFLNHDIEESEFEDEMESLYQDGCDGESIDGKTHDERMICITISDLSISSDSKTDVRKKYDELKEYCS